MPRDTASVASSTKSRDRLANLVMRRAKRSVSATTDLTEDELQATIASEVSQGRRVRDVLKHVQHATPSVRSNASVTSSTRPSSLPPAASPSVAPSHNRNNAASVALRESMKAIQSPPRFKINATPHIPIRAPKETEDLWGVLAKQKDAELVEIRARARAVHNEKLTQQKAILDEQCAIRKRRKAEERAAHLAERSVVDAQKVQFDEQTKAVIAAHKDIAEQIKVEREQQVADRKVRKQKLEEERQAIDQAILVRMQAELAQEKVEQQRVRDRQIQFREELIVANEEQKKRVAERKAVEAELEAAAGQAYLKRVEKEAAEREAAFLAMKDKMKGREAMALALQATIDEKAAEDERRAEAVTEARYQAKIAKEEAEKEKKKVAQQVVLDFRARQLQIKREQEVVENGRLLQEKYDAEAEVRESIKVLAQRKEVERRKVAQCRQMIEEQMKDNAEFNPVRMSEEEKLLNKAMLSRASPSP